jgi:hypothetical protein
MNITARNSVHTAVNATAVVGTPLHGLCCTPRNRFVTKRDMQMRHGKRYHKSLVYSVSNDDFPSSSSSTPGESSGFTTVQPVAAASSHEKDDMAPLASSSSADDHQVKRRRMARLKAQKFSSMVVIELEKPIQTYMTLPASQYSVLDAKKIERIDEDTFRCYVGGLNFLNFKVEPVLTLSVIVGERGPTVRLLETKLEGSKAALEANAKFTATMQNIVEWQQSEDDENKYISSDTTIEVTLEIPGWFVLPTGVVERSGSAVMQKVLDTAVPRFLKQLQSDYEKWSLGQDR